MSNIDKRYILFIVLLLLIIFTIFISEFIASRVIGLGDPIVYDSSINWGYSPRANRTYTRFSGKIVSINNVGLRSSQDWVNDGSKRIVFFGDSVTYGGSYIDNKDTFSELTCKNLPNWKCYNAGVNAYGILNMVNRSRFDRRIKAFDLAIFVFITKDFLRGLQDENTAHFILSEPPGYFPALWEALNWAAAKYSPVKFLGKRTDKAIFDEGEFENAVDFSLEILVREARRITGLGKQVLFVHSPTLWEITNGPSGITSYVMERIASYDDLSFISLERPLRESLQENTDTFRDNAHYGLDGHRVVSDHISMHLRKLLKITY